MTEVVEAPTAPHVVAETQGSTRSPEPRPRRRLSPSHRVQLAAAVLIVGQLLVRGWIALAGALSQDDLVVAGRSARLPLFSAEFLFPDADRFAPLADLLTAALTRMAPLEYWPMAAALVVLQALALLAVLRLLRLLLGDRPVLLLPLALYLFSPLSLAAFDNWSAAVTAVPFQAGLAWVCGDALALHRTGRRIRYAVSGTLAFGIALSFGEQAVVIPAVAAIPVVAFTVLAVVLRQSGETTPVLATARRGLWLWIGLAATSAALVWRSGSAVLPRTVPDDQSGTLATAVDAVGTTLTDGILPALLGGPLFWRDFGTWADPPTALVAAAVVVVAVAGWLARRREGGGLVWLLLAGYILLSVLVLVVGRLTSGATAEFALDLRSFADIALVTAIAVALLVRAPVRDGTRTGFLDRTERRDAAVLLTIFFVGLSLWSTASYDQTRNTQPARDYLATAQRSLLTAEAPVLDHAVASSVVWGLSAPYNRVSWVFAPAGVRTSASTDDPKVLGAGGHLVDARVAGGYASVPGPEPACGHRVRPLGTTDVPLADPAGEADWTVQLNYLAGSDGWILVSLGSGEGEVAPVRKGVNAVYLSLRGEGDRLRVSGETPGMALCIDRAMVGVLEAAD
ncbi:hypothetical protein [Blastococcus haudaquaticus]|uniref:4-amino-4-deoxy-L-arabinose transferase n=1 Tax=Blastococcus haudaquaticus TaxID=1938745 RepID=A0A286H561_9ACTN|nr:hypothetical protein [Blastococcus haudaquaticus]SOE02907.1 hypothetical protein SAMN06272739_3867 [Blastococcus haudaquaticus]